MRVKIFSLILIFFFLFGLYSQEGEWWVGKTIKSIDFEGLVNISKSDLDGITKPYKGQVFTYELYQELLGTLFALDYFDNIETAAVKGDDNYNTVILNFIVQEKPVVSFIELIGNSKVRRSDILSAITIKEKDIYNYTKLKMDERAIRDLYLEKGFTNIRVTGSERDDGNGGKIVVFNIDEGRQTTISSISFEGNVSVTDKTLKRVMSLKEPGLFQNGAFKESQVELDKTAILRYYNERGFADAEIVSVIRETDSETEPGKDLVSLKFVIKEGEPYTFSGYSFDGNEIFTDEQLLAATKLKPGDVYNITQFQADFQGIADVYFNSGYTSNYIAPEMKRDNERRQIGYEIIIVERGRSHIENIFIRGNEKTKDHVILREFDIETGDIFSNSKVLSGMRNLYNLQYFSAIQPDVVQGSDPSLVNLILDVEEQNTASVQFGVTFSGITDANSFPVSVFASWAETNFMGYGQSLSSSLTLSPTQQSLSLSFGESWLAGKPISLAVSLAVYHSVLYAGQDTTGKIFSDSDWDNAEDNNIPPDPYDTWDEYETAGTIPDSYLMQYKQWGFSSGATVGYRWRPKFSDITWTGGLTFGLVRNFYDHNKYRPVDKVVRDKSKAWTWDNSIWTRVSFDARDLSFDPSKGWFASQQVSWQGLFPEIELEYFLRADTKLEGYIPLWNTNIGEFNFKGVLANYVGVSLIYPANGMNISDSSKLSVDGMFVGRGWSSESSSTVGQALFSTYTELRIPVVPGLLAFDFFFDSAATWSTISQMFTKSWTDNTFYFSFGPGIRFTIQQFPFRLMMANCFTVKNGIPEWKHSSSGGSSWEFVLSFNIPNS